MSKINYRRNNFFSKFTAATLVLGCVFLSSPTILLADVIDDSLEQGVAIETSPESQGQSTLQEVQAEGSLIDSTQVTAVTDNNTDSNNGLDANDTPSIDETVSETNQPVVEAQTETQATSDSANQVMGSADLFSENEDLIVDDTVADSENANTGSDSENVSTTEINNETDIVNENYAQVFNDSFMEADTGNNSANYNTGSGIIMTEKAKGDGELLNVLNKNILETSDEADSSSGASNLNTGSDSDNVSQTNINNQLTVRNINDANVINRFTARINSGRNDANFNTGHGMIATGDANLGLNFFSMANTNLYGSQKFYANLQNVYNSYVGNVDLSNELAHNTSALSDLLLQASNNSTGNGSNNQSVININDQTSVSNQNEGVLNNEIDAQVISGENSANYNVGTGSIASGDVNSSVNVVNFLNSNITSGNAVVKTLNVFGNWQGDLKLPTMASPALTAGQLTDSETQNSETGADSNNSANTNVNNSLSLTNNNTATIANDVTVRTESGENDASFNGGSGIVQVGSVDGNTNEINVANLNVTGDSWWLIVVNKFGTWSGNAVGAPDSVLVNSTGISTILTPSQSGAIVTNTPTGSESNNEAGVNINHTTDITNTNAADITTTLNIQAISGNNEAQRNSGHGYIQTGDIKAVNNIVNFANSNITVGNWVVVVVNVFGDWDGNLIFNTPGGGGNIDVAETVSCPVFTSNNGQSNTSMNGDTGSGSQNNNTTGVGNNNNANINNTTGVSSITGQNNANYNTGSGTISTGQADVGSSVGNQANSNNITNTGQDGVNANDTSNSSTGSGSENNSGSATDNQTDITNSNNAAVDNNLSGTNNTGQNNSNYNTGSTTIDTGWAQAFLDLMNKVNDNTVTIGDLTNLMSQAATVADGQQMQVLNAETIPEVCPGVIIEISPLTSTLEMGGTQKFVAVAKDSNGNALAEQPTFSWDATGGTIDSDGNYVAGSSAGSFVVTATASYGNKGTANIAINEPPSSGDNSGGGGSGGGGGGGSGGGGSSSASGLGGLTYALASPQHKKGDYNNDGTVDDLDFSILMANWGQRRTGIMASDSGDGTVDDSDFSLVMANWTTNNLLSKIINSKIYG